MPRTSRSRALGAFLHEPDGAVIRARLIGDVARSLEAGMLDEHIAYLTSDAALTSPFVASFRVREELPADTKELAKALRERGIGRLEIKKRGVDVDPAVLRKTLTLSGDESATLILTRIGNRRRVALLADRVAARVSRIERGVSRIERARQPGQPMRPVVIAAKRSQPAL